MKESDLYQPLKRFLELQGYDVKGEVQDCDVVAVRGGCVLPSASVGQAAFSSCTSQSFADSDG